VPIRKIVFYGLLGALLGFLGQFVFDFVTWNAPPSAITFFHWFSSDGFARYLMNSMSSQHWITATMLVYQGVFFSWLGGRSDIAIRTALITGFLLVTCVMGADEWSKRAKAAGRNSSSCSSLSWRTVLIAALAGSLLGLGGQFLYDYFFWEGRGKGWTMHYAFNDEVIKRSFRAVPDLTAAKVVCYQTMVFFWLGKRADVLGRTVLITTTTAVCLSLLASRFRRRKGSTNEVTSIGDSTNEVIVTDASTVASNQLEAVSSLNPSVTSSDKDNSPPPQLTIAGNENDSSIKSQHTDEDAVHVFTSEQKSSEH